MNQSHSDSSAASSPMVLPSNPEDVSVLSRLRENGLAVELMERGLLPEWLIRAGIRAICRERLVEEDRGSSSANAAALMQFIDTLRKQPIAVLTDKANEQHYELPPEFFTKVLGKNLKYSSCYFPEGSNSLDLAEDTMLGLYCERAALADGQDVLELGCGWGSLTLWMAARYPRSRIVGVSNSAPQREFILARARERNLTNVEILTADMNEFSAPRQFDRVVSIEMFEHMRNYDRLLEKVSQWLKPGASLFVHIFCHKQFAYLYESKGKSDWMSRYFFSGGTMPSDHLLFFFQSHLLLREHWRVSGTHYEKTSNCWADNLCERRTEILPILAATYGAENAERWYWRWMAFFLACAELFGFNNGEEWFVSHYRFEKPGAR